MPNVSVTVLASLISMFFMLLDLAKEPNSFDYIKFKLLSADVPKESWSIS